MLATIACFPTDKGKSVSKYVVESIKIIQKSGLDYKVGPMGTTIEGEITRVFNVIKKPDTDTT